MKKKETELQRGFKNSVARILRECLRIFRKALLAFAVFAALFALSAGVLFAAHMKEQNLSVPFAYLGDENLGLQHPDEVKTAIDNAMAQFAGRTISFIWDERMESIAVGELGFSLDAKSTMRNVPFSSSRSNAALLLDGIRPHTVEPVLEFDRYAFEKRLAALMPDIPRVRNAAFTRGTDGSIAIVPEQSGYRILADDLKSEVREKMSALDFRAVTVKANFEEPDIKAADLESQMETLMFDLKSASVYLSYNGQKWQFTPSEHLDFVALLRAYDGTISWTIQTFPMEKLIDEQLVPAISKSEKGVRISKDEQGRIIFDGTPESGYSVDRSQLIAAIYFAFDNDIDSIEVPVHEIMAPVTISDDLRALGIKEIIGHGYSTFYGSPANRFHNIGVGINRYNGLTVDKDAIFSFNANLGQVDESTGYRKELVIKNEGTIPEFGGGLCQVSTTMYRAILNAGLPLVERFPHTYAVTYYAQTGGHGLDATIYPGVKDLRFLNDTPAPILIQAYQEGYSAHYIFYGTSDGREVEMEGPYIANRRSAPLEAVEFLVDDMPAGERMQVQKPVAGFDTTWYRTVKKAGEERRETIFSHYTAMPAKYRVGADKESTEEEAI